MYEFPSQLYEYDRISDTNKNTSIKYDIFKNLKEKI